MGFEEEAEERYRQRHIVKLARRIAKTHADYHADAPPSRLVLEVRALARIASAAGIQDPDRLAELSAAIFDPHPSTLSADQRGAVEGILSNGATDPESRCRAISAYIAGLKD